MMPSEGLSEKIFAAYHERKWASNVYNLERMQAKDELLKLCDIAQQVDQSDLSSLSRGSTDEVPNLSNQKCVDSQIIYWYRNKKEQADLANFLKVTPLDAASIFHTAAQEKHATLTLSITYDSLWVGLRVDKNATIDRRNLAAKLEKGWEREQLLQRLHNLPEGISVGYSNAHLSSGGAGAMMAAETFDDAALTVLSHGLDKDKPTWQMGHTVSKEDALALKNELGDYLGRWLGVLFPLYGYVSWSRDNDFIDVTKQIKEEKAQERHQATSYQPGDKVRITKGLFSGQLGLVDQIDSKARVRVKVGKMSVVLTGHDLAPA